MVTSGFRNVLGVHSVAEVNYGSKSRSTSKTPREAPFGEIRLRRAEFQLVQIAEVISEVFLFIIKLQSRKVPV